jgi:hypothetical protein
MDIFFFALLGLLILQALLWIVRRSGQGMKLARCVAQEWAKRGSLYHARKSIIQASILGLLTPVQVFLLLGEFRELSCNPHRG